MSIEKIAQTILGIKTLETRGSDSLDFHVLAVWEIEEALLAAYRLGSINTIKIINESNEVA